MLCKGFTGALKGIEAELITVEVQADRGVGYHLVGMPDVAVRESQYRIAAALKSCGLKMMVKRMTINLTPADIRKQGTGFDLPIALGILQSSGQLMTDQLSHLMIVGALSLDGSILPVPGTLSMAKCALRHGLQGIIVPWENSREAALVEGIPVYGAKHLTQITSFLVGGTWLKPIKKVKIDQITRGVPPVDLSQIRGQMMAKRALEISSLGNHHMLMMGPPGVGKTLLAQAISGILPAMSDQEIQEVTQVYSARNHQAERLINCFRPFRQPHHNCTSAGMLGGGNPMLPGEVSLAHRGVLYLDELPEFRKNVLEGLRQPLEAQKIILARGGYHLELPASFTLIASMNPSPYQYEEDRAQPQAKTDAYRDKQYRQRISQPLLDRIPLQIDMPKLSQEELLDAPIGPSSPMVLARIERSYRFRQERIAQEIDTPELWWQKVEKDAQIKLFWVRYMKEKKYSVRTQSMIFDVARTIADLAQSEYIALEHIYEAIQYRSLDRYFEENSSVNRILNI